MAPVHDHRLTVSRYPSSRQELRQQARQNRSSWFWSIGIEELIEEVSERLKRIIPRKRVPPVRLGAHYR